MWEEIKQFVVDFFVSLGNLFRDLGLWFYEKISGLLVYIFDSIPLPSFITTTSLDSLLPSEIVWFLSVTSFPEALLIISAGITFRILRRFLTLGIW